ncbi:hypothetical protein EDB83DRAFT_2347958 [Lactarius deliciosus]|nr:hypothetical protein EDB83DRAFT_2347958 [Lactarius deliciosus]
MGDSQYVNRKTAAGSYRPSGYVRLSPLSPGCISSCTPQMSRGVKNAITGLAISSFAVGVWLYSMSAVKQDNFDDVDEEARAMVMSGVKDSSKDGGSS